MSDVARKLVALGTTRLSRSSAERLRTLSVSAHGVDLPRLERSLRTLADDVELGLAHAAQADAAGLLARAAQVEALAHALRTRPTPQLVGEHRTSYEPVGDIEIVGLGARRWRASSGYQGLTVYFWDRSANRWASWTEARPLSVGGLDPSARYDAEGPWTGLVSPASASRHALRLTGAYRNRVGRLSGRASTRAFSLAPTDPRDPRPARTAGPIWWTGPGSSSAAASATAPSRTSWCCLPRRRGDLRRSTRSARRSSATSSMPTDVASR